MSQVIDLYEDSDGSDDVLVLASPPRQLSRKRPRAEPNRPDAVSRAAGKKSFVTDLEEPTLLQHREKKRQRSNNEASSDAVSGQKLAGHTGSLNRKSQSVALTSSAWGSKRKYTTSTTASRASPICLDDTDESDDDDDDATPRKMPAVATAHTPQQWAIMFKELCEYRKKNGDCLVPETWPENPNLGEWVATQREQYRLHAKKHESSMTAVRIKSLESIEFVWDASDTVWRSRFRVLVEFEDHHKHCNVSQADDPELAEWVKEQQEQYKLHQEGKASTMTLERVDDLECLEFPWTVESDTGTPSGGEDEATADDASEPARSDDEDDARSGTRSETTRNTRYDDLWVTRFRELCDYRDKIGDCLVPVKYPENPALGRWVTSQRKHLPPSTGGDVASSAENRVPRERVKALDDIGFVWNVAEAAWATRFNQLVEFQKLHSHCHVPRVYSKNPQLGNWVRTQRLSYMAYHTDGKTSGITPERILQLENLGFQWQRQRTNVNDESQSSTNLQTSEHSEKAATTTSESDSSQKRTDGPRDNSQKNHLSFSHHLLLVGAIRENERSSADDKPANAAPDEDDDTAQQVPQDKMFQSDKILDPVELELLWLGEESILCLSCSEFQFDFIYEYASSALRVSLRKLSQDAESEAERLKQLVRMNDWMVARRVDIVRKEVQQLLARGYRRRFMGTVIAELRLLRRQGSERHFPPIGVVDAKDMVDGDDG